MKKKSVTQNSRIAKTANGNQKPPYTVLPFSPRVQSQNHVLNSLVGLQGQKGNKITNPSHGKIAKRNAMNLFKINQVNFSQNRQQHTQPKGNVQGKQLNLSQRKFQQRVARSNPPNLNSLITFNQQPKNPNIRIMQVNQPTLVRRKSIQPQPKLVTEQLKPKPLDKKDLRNTITSGKGITPMTFSMFLPLNTQYGKSFPINQSLAGVQPCKRIGTITPNNQMKNVPRAMFNNVSNGLIGNPLAGNMLTGYNTYIAGNSVLKKGSINTNIFSAHNRFGGANVINNMNLMQQNKNMIQFGNFQAKQGINGKEFYLGPSYGRTYGNYSQQVIAKQLVQQRDDIKKKGEEEKKKKKKKKKKKRKHSDEKKKKKRKRKEKKDKDKKKSERRKRRFGNGKWYYSRKGPRKYWIGYYVQEKQKSKGEDIEFPVGISERDRVEENIGVELFNEQFQNEMFEKMGNEIDVDSFYLEERLENDFLEDFQTHPLDDGSSEFLRDYILYGTEKDFEDSYLVPPDEPPQREKDIDEKDGDSSDEEEEKNTTGEKRKREDEYKEKRPFYYLDQKEQWKKRRKYYSNKQIFLRDYDFDDDIESLFFDLEEQPPNTKPLNLQLTIPPKKKPKIENFQPSDNPYKDVLLLNEYHTNFSSAPKIDETE